MDWVYLVQMHYLGIIRVGSDLIFQPLPVRVLIQVSSGERSLSRSPVVGLFGVTLEPMIGIRDSNLTVGLALVQVHMV